MNVIIVRKVLPQPCPDVFIRRANMRVVTSATSVLRAWTH